MEEGNESAFLEVLGSLVQYFKLESDTKVLEQFFYKVRLDICPINGEVVEIKGLKDVIRLLTDKGSNRYFEELNGRLQFKIYQLKQKEKDVRSKLLDEMNVNLNNLKMIVENAAKERDEKKTATGPTAPPPSPAIVPESFFRRIFGIKPGNGAACKVVTVYFILLALGLLGQGANAWQIGKWFLLWYLIVRWIGY